MRLVFSTSTLILESNQLIAAVRPPEWLSLVCAVSAPDGEADVRVLGSQPGVSPHSPEGEENPGQDAGVPRHQTVTETETGLKDATAAAAAAAAATSAGPTGERE